MNSDGLITKERKELLVDDYEIIYVCRYIDVTGVYCDSGMDGLVSEIADKLLLYAKEHLHEIILRYNEYYISDNNLTSIREILLNYIEHLSTREGFDYFLYNKCLHELQEVVRHYKASTKREALMKIAGIEEQDCPVDNIRRAM